MKRAIALFVVSWAVCIVGAAPADGQTFDWTNAGGGQFNTAANWVAGGPPNSSTETARFNLTSTYTVTFQTNVTNATSNVSNGTVTFDLNGRTYALSAGLLVGSIANQTGRLTLTDGTMTGVMTVGGVGATGAFTIGTAALFNAGAVSTAVGNAGVGTLTVSNGGDYTGTAPMVVGNTPDSDGSVTVTDIGSSLTCGDLTLGSNGVARDDF